MNINELFQKTIAANASDLHLIAGLPPMLRAVGKLQPLTEYQPLQSLEIQELMYSIINEQQKKAFIQNRSLDFSFGVGGGNYGDQGRFRINIYFQRNTIACAARLLPSSIKTVEELSLPQVVHSFSKLRQGFVIVAGPTGHGKSTTLAALINEINLNSSTNIITIEDPIEYMYPFGKSIISQREIGLDTMSWAESLKSALREDPDVLLVGEMRDPESISSAITIAETGHLVFSTLHTNSAAQAIDRIIDSFPDKQQNQIRAQLSGSLAGVISQRLIPTIEGGRIVACEILIANNAVKSNIREGKTHLIDSIIQTSQDIGMVPLESSLAFLVKQGIITLDIAKSYSLRVDALMELI